MPYTIEHEGDSWVYSWPEFQIGARAEMVVERRDGLFAELTFQQIGNGSGPLHLHGPVRTNLVSTIGHDSLIKHLSPKTRLDGDSVGVPWGEIVEVVCARTAREFRRGPEPVVLADVAVPRGGLPYLMRPMLPVNETTLVYGPGKSLKSTLALGLAMTATQGTALPGMSSPERPVSVLYLDWESEEDEHAERLLQLARGFGMPPPRTIHYRHQIRGVREDQGRLKELRAQLGAELVIYDSLAGACADDMTEQSVATTTLTAMRNVGGTRLVLGHMARAEIGKEDGPGHVFGSAFFDNYARSLWEVRTGVDTGREDGDAHRIMGLFHRAVNRGRVLTRPLLLALHWDRKEEALTIESADPSDDKEVASHATWDVRIRETLRGGAKTAAEIADELGQPDKVKSIDTTLRRMPMVIELSTGVKGDPARWGLR